MTQTLDIALLREFAEAHVMRSALEEHLARLTERTTALGPRVVAHLAEVGVTHVPVQVDVSETFDVVVSSTIRVGTRTQTRTSVTDIDALIPALESEGLGDLVKTSVNANSISATVRRWLDDDQGETLDPLPARLQRTIPPGVLAAIRVAEFTTATATKA